jgi:3-hydroxyisobutyrate dehydrogenase-like beta-hydroxyacid dehydrogenase
MGGAMARAVLNSGRDLVVCDLDQAKVDALVTKGATAAHSPGEVAAQADVVAVVVAMDAHVLDVVENAGDTPWLIHSTVSPETVFKVAERAPVLDAPVTGGEIGAESGELAIMVGGDAALLERVRPAMEPYASLVVHLGGLGAGQRTKLARNLVTYAELVMAYEVRQLVAAAGIDEAAFRQIVAHSDRTIPAHGGLLLEQRWLAGVSPAIPHKDVRAALGVARQLGVEVPLADEVDVLLDVAMAEDGA